MKGEGAAAILITLVPLMAKAEDVFKRMALF